MPSKKTKVIELIFNDPRRWVDGKLVERDVSFDDVQEAIIHFNDLNPSQLKKLSDKNTANFFKDFLRKHKSMISNWPSSVKSVGYWGVQAKGNSLCFRFVDYIDEIHSVPPPPPDREISCIFYNAQTLSVNPLNKALARTDENWLMAIATQINIPQIHFTLHSIPGWNLVSLNHVQSNMKLKGAEIDGVFIAEDKSGKIALICIEAKAFNDDILEFQIVDQIIAAQKLSGFRKLAKSKGSNDSKLFIIPAALKLFKRKNFPLDGEELSKLTENQSILYFVHYNPVQIDQPIEYLPSIAGQTAFLLTPPLAGI
jgi:hypothetical protein